MHILAIQHTTFYPASLLKFSCCLSSSCVSITATSFSLPLTMPDFCIHIHSEGCCEDHLCCLSLWPGHSFLFTSLLVSHSVASDRSSLFSLLWPIPSDSVRDVDSKQASLCFFLLTLMFWGGGKRGEASINMWKATSLFSFEFFLKTLFWHDALEKEKKKKKDNRLLVDRNPRISLIVSLFPGFPMLVHILSYT